eukprot:NODE_28522_length_474_cov_7.913545.p2 GENE.NODE_28522_length_474_cov_7.913545~~NODE_28522_length_474_cov_7.913545.p2  ORF type:complete len:104 (+),score=14.47 NODE_28522_length_474_cov_7.913545:62-373(+)
MNLFVAIVLTTIWGAVSEDALWWRHRHHRWGGHWWRHRHHRWGEEDMDTMASATDNLPDMDDPMVIGLVAFGLGALMAGALVLVVTRTRRTSALTSSLLVDEK